MRRKSAGRSSDKRSPARRFLHLPGVVGVLTVCLLSCAQTLPDTARVRRVIDGDTVELADGRLVRYIGIDTPEVRRRVGDRWVDDPEPFGQAASEANRRLVEGQRVRLEYDVQTHDRFGRLLAYVYVAVKGDGERMVNAELMSQGFARLLTIPPDVRYVERFRALAEAARQARRGLWGRD